jgi:hypothetical protein
MESTRDRDVNSQDNNKIYQPEHTTVNDEIQQIKENKGIKPRGKSRRNGATRICNFLKEKKEKCYRLA